MGARMRMRLGLPVFGNRLDPQVARLASAQVGSLGELLHAAYAGTVDDEGETVADATQEIEATLGGKYGEVLEAPSGVITINERLEALCIVSLWRPDTVPLVVYSATHPRAQRCGLAQKLLLHAAAELSLGPYRTLDLFVTVANMPAVRLYEKVGFRRLDGAGA